MREVLSLTDRTSPQLAPEQTAVEYRISEIRPVSSNMNIAENIAFGLKIKKESKAYIDDKIKYALKLVNLDGYENRNV